MKKITSLIISGMLMLSVVGCGNVNQVENVTVQEQQIENPDMDKAIDLAREVVGDKYNATIGQSFMKDTETNTIIWMFVSDRFTLCTTLDDAGVVRDYEHLKEEVVRDYEKISKAYTENGIEIKLVVDMKTYPNKVTYFSIDKDGNVCDILNEEFMDNEDNWGED